jgi:hypothetical protein
MKVLGVVFHKLNYDPNHLLHCPGCTVARSFWKKVNDAMYSAEHPEAHTCEKIRVATAQEFLAPRKQSIARKELVLRQRGHDRHAYHNHSDPRTHASSSEISLLSFVITLRM